MPTQVPGRRRSNVEDFEQGGDYCVVYDDGGRITSLWFWMPGFKERNRWNRIQAEASPEEKGPKWKITEGEEGRVTVSPSIRSQWTWGEEKAERLFHAFLKDGTWELLDDCVGMES